MRSSCWVIAARSGTSNSLATAHRLSIFMDLRKTGGLARIVILRGGVWRGYATDDWFQRIYQGRKMPLSHRIALGCGTLAVTLLLVSRGAADDLPWQRSPWFEEQAFTVALEPAGRIHVNAPLPHADGPARATRIIVYALPNGNTIEQTLGCRMAEGLDWHYDIQHVAAQIRLLRSLDSHVGESLRDSHS